MDGEAFVVKLYGLPFNITNIASGLVAFIIVAIVVIALSRQLSMKPTGKQNVLEWLIDFTNGIVKSAMPGEEGKKFNLLAFTLFLFIFVSNQLGLFLQIGFGDKTLIKSPTSSPLTTLTFAFLVILLSHFMGVIQLGFKGYLKNSYLSPVAMFIPINLIEEFTNLLTLALRLYGNIYAGEVLLTLIGGAVSMGPVMTVVALPVEMIWQGFSLFIGSIQAYVFVTLSMVYIGGKVQKE
ncbi:ATP synthase subunit a [Dellaglioa algida]|nr:MULTISPECIES: F0F1 ATP synthase subunit A [Dellaglioa]MCZ2490682.1 F0F1 ATP synthase subunit A [Dellaglioa carnosa]MCZ2492311.1 F0F1 ATP synthase subunit A [Dellaglioa carnosa]MCZ2493760.1 F0F1 ATP synthase subunit A [Dellaglioa carnosa]MDK1716845.1 F0F1 ATP synthase subunit A [Dellaglioa algida]MDK1719619.1 F0F1 ATP synthase subunit A [Dellaglioa algida]